MIWIAWLFSAGLCFLIAERKGKNPIVWGIAGLLFGVFALFTVAITSTNSRFSIDSIFKAIGYAVVGGGVVALLVMGPVGWLTGAGIAQIAKMVIRSASGESNGEVVITAIGGFVACIVIIILFIGIASSF